MIESQFKDKLALAHVLKSQCTGEAALALKSIYPTTPGAYKRMFEELDLHFGDSRLIASDAKEILVPKNLE